MKTKRCTFLFFMICICSMLYILPASAKANPVPKKIMLTRKTFTLYIGESRQLLVQNVRPEKASEKVYWKVENKRIAVVSPKGQITAKKAGKTTVYAVSRKNPDVTASVRVVVKRRLKKKEKVCNVAGKIFEGDTSGSKTGIYLKDDTFTLRTKEDFLELKKILNKWKKGTYKKSCLKKYENTDFSKESLVVIFTGTSGTWYGHHFTSCATRLDQDGKLCGVVKIQYKEMLVPPGYAVPGVLIPHTIIMRMNKKEEAMIDYFKVEMIQADEKKQ